VRSRTRTLVWASVALLALAAAAVWALPRWVDADRFRPAAESAIASRLGREVELGRLRLSVGWGVWISADSLRVGAPLEPVEGPAPTASAGAVRLRTAVLPLLAGRVDIRAVEVRRARVEQDGEPLLSDLALDADVRTDGDALRVRGRIVGRGDVLWGARFDARFEAVWLGPRIELSALDAVLGPGRIEGTGSVSGIGSGATAVDLVLSGAFGETVARGTFRADVGDRATAVDFRLDADLLDLDGLAALAGWSVRGSGTRSARAGGGSGLVPAAFADEPGGAGAVAAAPIVARGTVEAVRARFAGLDLTALSMAVTYDEGRLRFDDARFDVYGGRHDGRFEMVTDDPALPFRLVDRFEGVDVGALLAAFSPDLAGTLAGTASLSLAVDGRAAADGADGTVRGTADVRIESGRLAGIALLDQIAAALSSATGRPASTEFDLVAASFDLRDRRARTDDLRLRSRDLDLDGRGTVAFDGALDLDVTASLEPGASAAIVRDVRQLEFRVGDDGRLTLPVRVGGTLAEPEVGIDLRRVLEEGLGRKLRDKLKGLFRR